MRSTAPKGIESIHLAVATEGRGRYVERVVEVPVERVVERVVEVPVERVVYVEPVQQFVTEPVYETRKRVVQVPAAAAARPRARIPLGSIDPGAARLL